MLIRAKYFGAPHSQIFFSQVVGRAAVGRLLFSCLELNYTTHHGGGLQAAALNVLLLVFVRSFVNCYRHEFEFEFEIRHQAKPARRLGVLQARH